MPQSSKPRTTPSGGGGAPGAPGAPNNPGAPPTSPGGGGGAPGAPKTGYFRPILGATLENPTADDPTGGYGDAYDALTAPNQTKTRPMTGLDKMAPNTPQRSKGPIPTISSPSNGPGTPGGADEDDDDDDRREASLIARRAAQLHAQRALAGVR